MTKIGYNGLLFLFILLMLVLMLGIYTVDNNHWMRGSYWREGFDSSAESQIAGNIQTAAPSAANMIHGVAAQIASMPESTISNSIIAASPAAANVINNLASGVSNSSIVGGQSAGVKPSGFNIVGDVNRVGSIGGIKSAGQASNSIDPSSVIGNFHTPAAIASSIPAVVASSPVGFSSTPSTVIASSIPSTVASFTPTSVVSSSIPSTVASFTPTSVVSSSIPSVVVSSPVGFSSTPSTVVVSSSKPAVAPSSPPSPLPPSDSNNQNLQVVQVFIP